MLSPAALCNPAIRSCLVLYSCYIGENLQRTPTEDRIMQQNPYFMRDLNGHKVDSIMNFNVALRRSRSRSVLEISVFFVAVAGYLAALAFTA